MFRNTFQSGFLSILYSLGSKPLEIWQGEGMGCNAGPFIAALWNLFSSRLC